MPAKEAKATTKPAAAAKKAAPKTDAAKPAAPKAAKPAAAKPAAKPAVKAAAKPAAAKPAAAKPAVAKPAAAKPKTATKAKKPAVRKTITKTATKAQLIQKKKAVRPLKLVIDCNNPVTHGIIDISSFEKFLHDKFKVTKKSKAGVLGDQVTITKDKTSIIITLKSPIYKKYLKHLTKRYLKKQQLRDWLRVVSTNKSTYELRYYNIQEAGDESESEDED